MYNHGTADDCVICPSLRGEDDGWSEAVIAVDDWATARVNARFWGRNEGHIVVVSNEHFENLYDAPLDHLVGVQEMSRKMALLVMDAYGCDGTSTRQHNGPAGNQDAFHFHQHVFPRYVGDKLYDQTRRMSTPEERAPYGAKLLAGSGVERSYSHEPPGYECPFCITVGGGVREDAWRTQQSDIVARTDGATAWIAPGYWERNAGHVLVVPNTHIENIYGLTPDHARPVMELVQQVAIALMDTYSCDGTSTRQHNGPGGDQEVWHYHMHVFPRYEGDGLYGAPRQRWGPEERRSYAERLREWFSDR
ncbi:MAG: HIT domain-containing protein [Actinomycetota bacterium]